MVGSGISALGLLLLMQGSVGEGTEEDIRGPWTGPLGAVDRTTTLAATQSPNITLSFPQMRMESRDFSTHGVVREMCGTERAVGVRQQLRTPTSAYACGAATGTVCAIISGQMKICGGSICGHWAGPVAAYSS